MTTRILNRFSGHSNTDRRSLTRGSNQLKMRKAVYEHAKLKHPERWARSTRNWDPEESVALNPMKAKLAKDN